ncbi:MAG: sensor histidine kinase, partial [Ktedonobacteraceae bacterium]
MGLAARDKPQTQTLHGRAGQIVPGLPTEQLTAPAAYSLVVDLAEEHAILANIASNLRSGFILLNQGEHIAYANPVAQRLLDLDPSSAPPDVRTQLVEMAANPASAQAELDRLWQHPEQDDSADLALTDAAVRWLRVQSFPIHAQPGQLLGRGLLLDDITLERSATQTRNETLAMAAHGLKTPLAIIKGSATTLLSNSMRWEPAMQREMLQMIDTQTDRLHEILNTLLDVWRLDAGAQNLRFSQVH